MHYCINKNFIYVLCIYMKLCIFTQLRFVAYNQLLSNKAQNNKF